MENLASGSGIKAPFRAVTLMGFLGYALVWQEILCYLFEIFFMIVGFFELGYGSLCAAEKLLLQVSVHKI